MLNGVDVSFWQNEIDWKAVKKAQDFAIIRSSYGVGYTDKKFEYNRSECRRLNIPHGFYHYSYPNHNEPEAEADWFLSVVGKLASGESLYLDFEEKHPNPVKWSLSFLDRISEALGGYKPLIYINKFTAESFDWSSVADKGYGLWLAYWDYDPDGSFKVPHWNIVAIRQYSNKGSVKGIEGRVDENVFYGDLDQFYAYGVKMEEIPCEKVKSENKQLKSDKTVLQKENRGLLKSLKDLNLLYKKLLEEDKIEDAELKKLLKSLGALTKLYDDKTTALFEKDKALQGQKELNKHLIEKNLRLEEQKFSISESITFLIRAIRGVKKN